MTDDLTGKLVDVFVGGRIHGELHTDVFVQSDCPSRDHYEKGSTARLIWARVGDRDVQIHPADIVAIKEPADGDI